MLKPTVLLPFLLDFALPLIDIPDGASDSLYQIVEAVQGGVAELPCSLNDREEGDSVYLVLWYKREDRTPIYSYDSRSPKDEGLPNLWSEPTVFGERAVFYPNLGDARAFLRVRNITKQFDEGDYTCRVDFRQSPTKYHRVRLRVIVPPGVPELLDAEGERVQGVLGPYREGNTITVSCQVTGGIPPPKVQWYRDSKLIDDTDQRYSENIMKNRLTIQGFKREYLNSRFRCTASNNNLSLPLESSIKIDMIFPPVGVKISADSAPFSVGKEYILRCISWGSNPPARLEWGWVDLPSRFNEDRGDLTSISQAFEWNVTKSSVTFRPVSADRGRELTCSAGNPEMSSVSLVQDKIKLQVYYPPTVELAVGKAINLEDLEEGDDVYFECSVEANPPPYKVTWLHNEVEIFPHPGGNIIMSNQSLVLQKVHKEQGGEYRCHASNVEGDGISERIKLNIMYAPTCREKKDRVYGASENETVLVECQMDSYPQAHSFSWFFNNSLTSTLLPKDSFSSTPGHSLLSYTPRTHMEFGTLLCWADNLVGNQKKTRPCVYHIIPTGPPEVPNECVNVNQTESEVVVECRLGYSGGLPQKLHLEVYSNMGALLANKTGFGERLGTVRISVHKLPPGSQLQLVLYTSNSKGRSQLVRMEAFTLDYGYVDQVLENPLELEFEQVPGISILFISLTVTVLVMVFSLFLVSAYRRKRSVNRMPVQKAPVERLNHQIQDYSLDRSPDILKDTPEELRSGFQGAKSKQRENIQGGRSLLRVSSPPEGGFRSLKPGLSSEWSRVDRVQEEDLSNHNSAVLDPYHQKFYDSGGQKGWTDPNSQTVVHTQVGWGDQRDMGLQLALPLSTTAVHRIGVRTPLLDEDRESCV